MEDYLTRKGKWEREREREREREKQNTFVVENQSEDIMRVSWFGVTLRQIKPESLLPIVGLCKPVPAGSRSLLSGHAVLFASGSHL